MKVPLMDWDGTIKKSPGPGRYLKSCEVFVVGSINKDCHVLWKEKLSDGVTGS